MDLITDILTGSKSSKIQNYHFDKLPAYNTCKEFSKSQCRIWIDDLIRQGYLARTGDKYPVIRLTNKGNSMLLGETMVMLSVPEQGTVKRSIPHMDIMTTSGGEKLFLELRQLRKSLADQARVPPYVIFPDRSLREMAEIRPCDEQTFRNIVGVGDVKLEKYGTAFISVIQTFCEANGNETTDNKVVPIPESGDTLEQIYKLNQEIFDLNDKLKELTVLKSSLLDQAVKAGIKQQGKYALQSSSVSIRQLNLEAFKQLYPEVFMEIGSVKLSDADRIIGKAEVTELCTLKESITYKVVEM